MAAQQDLQSYIQSIWDLLDPSTRESGNLTKAEIVAKIDEAKGKIVELIKDLEDPRPERAFIVGMPDTATRDAINRAATMNRNRSTPQPGANRPVVFLEDDAEDDDFHYYSGDAENLHEPLNTTAGSQASGGPPTSFVVTSHEGGFGPQVPIGESIELYYDDDHPEIYHNRKKEKIEQLYRLLYWLDFISKQYNGSGQTIAQV